MGREIDEAWIEEAIERHRRIDALKARFDKAVLKTKVTVRSPDETVEVVVTAAGDIVDVQIRGPVQHRTPADLSRSVHAAVTAAADAARWARRRLHDDLFSDYRPLRER